MLYLKECPFCKSSKLKYDAEAYNGVIDSRLYVECKSCGSQIYTYGKTIEDAVFKYNREIAVNNKVD